MENLPPRILIADDDPYARDLIGIGLQSTDFRLISCADGDEARAEIEHSLPALAILDIQMPGPSGIDLCRMLKAQKESFVPVILLTAQSEVRDKIHGLNCGADDYVTKPFIPSELEARVRALLRIKKLTDELRQTKDILAERERDLVALQVAGGAAHELGQPLTAVLLHCQLLKRQNQQTQESEGLLSALNSIVGECNHMREVLDRMSSLSSHKLSQYTHSLRIVDLSRRDRDSEELPNPSPDIAA